MRIVLKGGGRRPEHQCWSPPAQWSPPPQLQFAHRPPNSNLPKLQHAILNLKGAIRVCCLLPLPMGGLDHPFWTRGTSRRHGLIVY